MHRLLDDLFLALIILNIGLNRQPTLFFPWNFSKTGSSFDLSAPTSSISFHTISSSVAPFISPDQFLNPAFPDIHFLFFTTAPTIIGLLVAPTIPRSKP